MNEKEKKLAREVLKVVNKGKLQQLAGFTYDDIHRSTETQKKVSTIYAIWYLEKYTAEEVKEIMSEIEYYNLGEDYSTHPGEWTVLGKLYLKKI